MYCHMGDFGCGGGGWTTVIKMDGNKVSYTKKDVIHFITPRRGRISSKGTGKLQGPQW